jgi:hypothetical protein
MPFLAQCPFCDWADTAFTHEGGEGILIFHVRDAHPEHKQGFWREQASNHVEKTISEREFNEQKENDDTGELFNLASLGRAG